VLAVVVVVLAGGAVWLINRLRTETTPVSFDAAVAQFEQGQQSTTAPLASSSSVTSTPAPTTAAVSSAGSTTSTTSPTSTTSATSGSSPGGVTALPQPGVYRFATTGEESVALLNNPTRTYPAETPVVVEPRGCGVVVRWTPLAERTESWEMCLEGGGVRLAGYSNVHEFFGQREERVLVCEPSAWLIPPASAEDETTATCTGSGLTEVRTTQVVGRSTVTVGGEEVPAVEIEVSVDTSGGTVGTTTRRLTLAADDAFPLVWIDVVDNTTATAVGDAAYHEDLRLDAVSRQPG